MFGRLTIEAFPFYSAIAASGAAITVLGALSVIAVITYLRAWRVVLFDWVSSLDHKKIGIMYVMLALVMLMRGFIDAAMMRSQQAIASGNEGYLPAEHFDQIFHVSRHDHDLLHGHAVSLGADQSYHAAADRGARCRFPVHERDQPMAYRGWRRSGAHFACCRQILDCRMERLSTVFRRRVQSRSRRRLLALGSAHLQVSAPP